MQDKLITKDKVFIQDTNFSDVLYKSSGYEDFHTNLVKSNIEFDENKAYDLLPSGLHLEYLYGHLEEKASKYLSMY